MNQSMQNSRDKEAVSQMLRTSSPSLSLSPSSPGNMPVSFRWRDEFPAEEDERLAVSPDLKVSS